MAGTALTTAPTPHTGRWLTRTPARTPPRLTLLCFHHAGGAASAYAKWPAELGPDIDVLPVQLPGRERRVREPRLRDLDDLVGELDRHLDPVLRRRHVLYGHSMGALVAYALARHRHATGRRLPERLLLGAYPPPHLSPPLGDLLTLDDEPLAHRLIALGGMSPALLRYPEWLRAAAAIVRDDLRVCHSRDHSPATPPLPVPLDVFAGSADPLVPLSKARDWARHTTAHCVFHEVPGDHFFAHDPSNAFPTRLRALLTSAPAASSSPTP